MFVIGKDAHLLSVVIVAYKSRNEIGRCLSSIPATLDGGRSEIILVDNSAGTSEGVGDFVGAQFPHVRLIEPEGNVGFGRGNNLGFRAPVGNVCSFLTQTRFVINRRSSTV